MIYCEKGSCSLTPGTVCRSLTIGIHTASTLAYMIALLRNPLELDVLEGIAKAEQEKDQEKTAYDYQMLASRHVVTGAREHPTIKQTADRAFSDQFS